MKDFTEYVFSGKDVKHIWATYDSVPILASLEFNNEPYLLIATFEAEYGSVLYLFAKPATSGKFKELLDSKISLKEFLADETTKLYRETETNNEKEISIVPVNYKDLTDRNLPKSGFYLNSLK